jgi:hypothetical protein
MTSRLHYSSPVSEKYQLKYNAQIDDDGKVGIPFDNDVQKKVKAAIEKTKTNASTKAAYEDVTKALKEGRPRKTPTPEIITFDGTGMLFPFLYATDINECMNQVDEATRARYLQRQQIGKELPPPIPAALGESMAEGLTKQMRELTERKHQSKKEQQEEWRKKKKKKGGERLVAG